MGVLLFLAWREFVCVYVYVCVCVGLPIIMFVWVDCFGMLAVVLCASAKLILSTQILSKKIYHLRNPGD